MGKINYKNKQNKELGGLVNNLGINKGIYLTTNTRLYGLLLISILGDNNILAWRNYVREK